MRTVWSFMFISLALYGCAGNSDRKDTDILQGKNTVSKKGVVVSAHPQASRIGVSVLQKGGNAVDAAVATQFALAVCYPEAGNIGGGGFMVIRTSDGNTDVIDYREKAPLGATRDMYLGPDGNVVEGLSLETHLAAGIPGTVDGMIRVHSKYGKLSFREVIQPAIDLARKGYQVTHEQAESLNNNRDNFLNKNISRPAFVKDTEWKEEDVLVQADLAATLERIRDNGREGFYSGKTADLILKEMRRGNGIISEEDLKEYKAIFRAALPVTYRGYRIISVPPPSSGGIILFQLLKMVEPYPLGEWGYHSVRSIHLMAEAEKRAFADRAEYAGDADYVKVPVDGLLNSNYLVHRMADFNENRASLSREIGAGSPAGYVSEETTHFSVADEAGNAVAATTTLNNTFGSSIVVDGAGFLLNNQMDDFSVKPGFPNLYGLIGGEANSIMPGKRMLSSMTPAIVEKEGKLFLVLGSPGGSTIPTTVFQVIVNVIDFGFNLDEAVNAGRFHHQWLPDYIVYEINSIDSLTILRLKQIGHEMKPRTGIGRVNAIQILEDGSKAGCADTRGDNSSCGY